MTDSPETNNGVDVWTVGRLLTWTADYLKRRGSESPRLDAEVLLAQVLGWKRVQLYTHFDNEVGPRARGEFRGLVRQRSEGTPVAYLVGRKEFYSLPLKVTPAVLIPGPIRSSAARRSFHGRRDCRPPIASTPHRLGCLAPACPAHSHFLATDISREALAVASSNAEALGLADRVRFVEGDLLNPVADERPFDAIVSNPPYIPTDVIPTLEIGALFASRMR